MSLTWRAICRNSLFINSITKPVSCSIERNVPLKIFTSGIYYQNNLRKALLETRKISVLPSLRPCSVQPEKPQNDGEVKKPQKEGLIQRFKSMYRDYWYVLLPVHMATSAVWLGSFYYAVSCGVDVISILEYFGVSEKIIAPLRESSVGYVALTFALYKLATPLRYAVTIGGTTLAIKKLTTMGVIKPVPSSKRMKEILTEQKVNIQTQMKEKRTQVMDEMKRYKTEMRNMKNRVKKM